MAIPTFSSYYSKTRAPFQLPFSTKASQTTVAIRFSSFWGIAPFAGATPGAAAIPTNATAGALGQVNSGGVMRLAEITANLGQPGYLMVCDRLLHNGGLGATTTTAQTVGGGSVNRNSGGVGNFLAAEIYTQIGSTATTITASYTNQVPTSGLTSQATAFGGTGLREVQRIIPMPLAQGDSGVTACATVTVLASTLTAGSFGVTIFQPLFGMPVPGVGSQNLLYDSIELCCANMPQIVNNACLFYVMMANGTSSGVLQDSICLIEE